MLELSDDQRKQYLYRSYTTVDGLWFMKVEEKYGFDTALKIDNEVWKVQPKIQARMLKSMSRLGSGIESLYQCLTTKLSLDGFSFHTKKTGNDGFRLLLDDCPWHNAMVKSTRGHLSPQVGNLICPTEYSTWAAEFGDNIHFEHQGQICRGDDCCVLQFSQ